MRRFVTSSRFAPRFGSGIRAGAGLLVALFLSAAPAAPAADTNCAAAIDIVFVVDSSGSIEQCIGCAGNFSKARGFAHQLVDSFQVSPEAAHIGLVDFSGYSTNLLGLSDQATLVHEAIDSMPYLDGNTRTELGLADARAEFLARGRSQVNQVIILLTDGDPDFPDAAEREAANTRAAGIEIFSIGVGPKVKFEVLEKLSSPPSSDHVFTVDNFDVLSDILQQLLTQVCPQESTQIEPEDYRITNETCLPPNANADPDETVTVEFRLKNTGTAAATNLIATLLAAGGINDPSAPQAYGFLAPGGTAVGRPFTFRASGPCGGTLTATLRLQDGTADLGAATFLLPLGSTAQTVIAYAGLAVPIPDNSPAGTNISLAVTGLSGTILDLNFQIDGSTCSDAPGATTVGVDHTWVGDLVFELISPAGTRVVLIDRPGVRQDASGRNFCQTLLDDEAEAPAISEIQPTGLPPLGPPYSGVFQPQNPLASFRGENPNGIWILNVSDRAAQDTGNVRAFSLIFSTPSCCAAPEPGADLALLKMNAPDRLPPGSELTYTITATNQGPGTAPDVRVSDPLPADVQFLSVLPSQGACHFSNGTITCDFGPLEPQQAATATIRVIPGAGSSSGSDTNCQAAIDLVLVLDGSSSITTTDFATMKSFARDLVSSFSVSELGAHIGVVQFSSTARIQTEIALSSDPAAIRQAIEAMAQINGTTDTAEGLQRGQAELLAADRPGIANALILLTDGNADSAAAATSAAADIRAAGTEIFAIGVQGAFGLRTNELNAIASPPIEDHLYLVSQFDDLAAILQRLVVTACGTAAEWSLCNIAQVNSAVPDPNPADNSATACATVTRGLAQPPRLEIARAGNLAALHWPQSAAGFVLETTDTLNPPLAWRPVGIVPVLADGRFTVMVDVSARMRYFRLRKP